MVVDLALDSGAGGTIPADDTLSDVLFANSRLWQLHKLPAGTTSASYTLQLDVESVIADAEAKIGTAKAASSLFAFAFACPWPGTLSQRYASSVDEIGDEIRCCGGVMKRIPMTASASTRAHTVTLSLPISNGCDEVGVGVLGWARVDLHPDRVTTPESPTLPLPSTCLPDPGRPPFPSDVCTPDRVHSESRGTIVQGRAKAAFTTVLREIQVEMA